MTTAHYQLYRFLRDSGLETTLFTFNEIGSQPDGQAEFRFGASARLRKFIDAFVWFYLKANGSRSQAYQLVDIINSVPGVVAMNRALRRYNPGIVIIPDHGAPGLFLDAGAARVFMIAHHNPARFVNNPLLGDFCPIDAARAANLEQRALKGVEAVICPSEYMKCEFGHTYRFNGVVTAIPNILDASYIDAIATFDIHKELGVQRDVPVVYIPSAGSILKGARFVPEIVKRLGRASAGTVAFYLSGHISDVLHAELASVPSNVKLFLPGTIAHELNVSYVKACSFGVSPTLVENFGMAILEAGYCGVPMITFDVGGNSEVIENGKSGFLVPCPDLDLLISAAQKLFDDSFISSMRQSTTSSIRERFNFEQVGKRYLALFGIPHGSTIEIC